jgi:hypothetical protein
VDGITIAFERYSADADFGPLFRGLPDDRCQCPHWGYVKHGRLVYRYADGDDEITAGEAYYARPGHLDRFRRRRAGRVRPSAELAKTTAVIARNLAAGVERQPVQYRLASGRVGTRSGTDDRIVGWVHDLATLIQP